MPARKSTKSSSRSSKPKGGTRSKSTWARLTGKKSSGRRRQTASPPQSPSLWASLSPERRLDVIGVALALIGLVTLLSLISANRSAIIGSWVKLLSQLVGWGVYILPIGLLGIGLWLVLRNVERMPPFSVERVVGIILLYVNVLVILQALAGSPESALEIAISGQGGGYFGSVLFRALWTWLGGPGTVVTLVAWLLIALLLTLDLSTQEFFVLFSPLIANLRQSLITIWKKTQSRREIPTTPEVQTNGFTPLQRPPVSIPAEIKDLSQPKTSLRTPAIQWAQPPIKDILDAGTTPTANEEFIKQRARLIEDTLASFGAPAQMVEINRGPTITQFGVEPLFIETRSGRTRVRVGKIASLADDLALALAAPRIRIQAPVPGRSYVGIEVPNEQMTLVALRDILESELFQRKRTPLRFTLGRDVSGRPILADLTTMPHLLIAGTTGSGKSVCVNAILTCLLLHNTPDNLRLILVDPKRVELTGYNGIPHLLAPVVVEIERVIGALQWMTREMDKRYHTFAQVGARNISDYNIRIRTQGGKSLPYLVIVIDELADLMMITPDETERTITRLAQLARATGIHMILATQRPSVDVVTGLIKANFPARIAFAVASGVDSRVILDQPGAERLLGRGDMLYQAPDAPSPVRLQGVFVSEYESQKLVEFWRTQVEQSSLYAIPSAPIDSPPTGVPLKQAPLWEEMKPEEQLDSLYSEAVDLIRREGRASVSLLQRKMRIGYTRAARLIDTLEEKGIISSPEGNTQVRQVLDYGPAAPPKED